MLYCYLKKCFTGIIVLMLALVNTTYASFQDTTAVKASTPGVITGKVIDQYAHPVKGAKVMVKGTTVNAITDDEGQFSINAPVNSVLVVTYPNLTVNEVKVLNDKELTIRLLDNYIQQPDVVDVLYGTKRSSEVLGSVSTIYTNQLRTTPGSLYTYALPGQLAGLYTNQISNFANIGVPSALSVAEFGLQFVQSGSRNVSLTDNTEFQLRLRGQTPITVIDGVQREISSLDPESIESVSVLKDALSTILLGINSSKGILLVTTKKPLAGRPRINFTAQTGFMQSLGMPNPLPAYQSAFLYNEALQNEGLSPIYTAQDIDAFRNNSDPYGHPNQNWFDMLLNKNSRMTNYKLNVTGGSNVARYSVSLSYFNQGGIFKMVDSIPYSTNANLDRYMINSNINVNVTKNVTVELQVFGRVQRGNAPYNGINNLLANIYRTPNYIYPALNQNNTFGGTSQWTNNLLSQAQYSGYTNTVSNDILTNLDINYNLDNTIKGLSAKLKGNIAFQSTDAMDRTLVNQTYLFSAEDNKYSTVGNPSAQRNSFITASTARFSFWQASLNYNRQFGKHNVSGSLLYDNRSIVSNFDLSAVTQNRALKAGYNYEGKYFIEAAGNISGYNRYNPENQNGFFYAGGLGWQMAKENFIKDNFSWINSWKWRATFGRTGDNTVDRYSYYGFRQTYGSSLDSYMVGLNHAQVFVQVEDALSNPNMSWEKADKFDVGTDISLFNDHFQVTADYYRDNYFDLLMQRGRSIALIGTGYPAENIGKARYEGGELTLTYQGNNGNFNYFISANGSVQASKWIFIDELSTPTEGMRRTGRPVTTTFGYEAQGLYQTAEEAAAGARVRNENRPLQAGDIKYKDQNGDGFIDQFDAVPIGNNKPLIFYGTTLGFNYKGFSASVILQGVVNRDINVLSQVTYPFLGTNFGFGVPAQPYGQPYENILNRWTPETAASATSPRLALGGTNNYQSSSYWMKSGDYFRIKNAEIGYDLPYTWVKKLSVAGIRVFVNGENLFTQGGYQGMDPEVFPNNTGGQNYPYFIQRVINTGVSVKL
ncbi:SusC/RagA family TonB-linked outer membrane protein [Mucilaginibacter limnophilus]|nr:SusC/RagA family TonB-linked outer membrane protein [Mucilaginibacter limnophilus]